MQISVPSPGDKPQAPRTLLVLWPIHNGRRMLTFSENWVKIKEVISAPSKFMDA